METIWFLASLSLTLLILALNFLPRKQPKKLPPSPALALPLIGHLHLLKPPMHRTYQKFSQTLGPVFSLRFGKRHVVVVSSPAAVEECFTANDIILANRPRTIIGEYIGYNHTTVLASPYGEHWRNLRRLVTVEILSSSRLNTFQSIRQDEIKRLIQKLYQSCSQAQTHDFETVKLRPLFSEMTFNVIMRMVAGKRYFGESEDTEEARKFRGLIEEVFEHGGISNPADFFPLLRWIDFKDREKNLARLSKEMDAFLQGLIEQHRRDGSGDTMIDHLLSLQKSQPEYYSDMIIKGIIIIMLLAGTDTSSVTIEWAMSALLNHPDKLKKARDELDRVVGSDRLIDESELSNLPYLQNIISETFRLFPATPLLVPHSPSEDCKISGFDIPRGAILLVNAWAIHRDPSVWDDPDSFKPERFEGAEAGPTVLLPFGMGRRSCPGKGLAMRVVGLGLGSLIQGFEWERIGEEKIDLREGKGVSMPKVVPLEARCKARDVLRGVFSDSG